MRRIWSVGRADPTDIGNTVAPTLKIVPGLGIEGNMKDAERTEKRKPLTLPEVHEAYDGLEDMFPPVLSLKLAAGLSGYTESTLKKKVSEGCFKDCVSRGKPLLFWRDRFVLDLMNRRWSPPARPVKNDAHHAGGGDHEAN
jgi:hypothetical protein